MNLRLRALTALLVAQPPLICSFLCSNAWAQSETAATPVASSPTLESGPSATVSPSANASGTAPSPTAPSPTAPSPTAVEIRTRPAATEPASSHEQQLRGPIHVVVAVSGYDLTGDEVSNAIARDLGLSITPDAKLAQCRFLVQVERGKDLSLTFYGNNGLELKRVVKAPEASTDVSEIAALLAVNLVRDEAPELLPLLDSKPPKPPAPEPTPEPAKVAAPSQTPAPKAVPAEKLPFIPANASLVFPLTIMRDVDEHSVGFELGLVYSDVGAIDGAGISAAVLRTRSPSQGILIAGAVSIVGQPREAASPRSTLSGAQISGAASLARGHVDGLQISGAASVASGNVDGAQVSGAASVAWGTLEGAQISGAASVASGNVEGAQVSGAANVSNDIEGFQTSGGLNFATGNLEGAQIAGGVNVAKDVQGAQISLVNIGGNVDGAQIGLVNIGSHVQGAQLGLVNIAQDVDGASIGVVTYSKKGQTQISTWFDSTRPLNIGVRFVSGPLYALPSVGADPRNTEGFDFSLGLGARVPVQRFYVDVEGNSRMSFDDGSIREDEIDLRYRLTLGFKVASWLGVFAGGGVHHYFNTNDAENQNFKPFWCAGVDLL